MEVVSVIDINQNVALLVDDSSDTARHARWNYILVGDGRCLYFGSSQREWGPRALGHRSLLAAPLNRDVKQLLNQIKGRAW